MKRGGSAMDVYLNFNTEARAAIQFYEEVFNVQSHDIMTYAQMPDMEDQPLYHEMKHLIVNASLPIYGTTVMFSDVPEGLMEPVVVGTNITLVIQTTTAAETHALFDKLAAGGKVGTPLEKVFWADLYGALTDKFGIGWQINLTKEAA
jgi:PhnB protein